MSKLIGTDPNQVPSNADLGTAAFQDVSDFLTSRNASLSAINALVPKDAIDVFIYDTSLDSDGGLWRNRCQNTSWFNEPLNTATRGSRREFPSVVVIVIESTRVTFYDADDPSLPMWMTWEQDGILTWASSTTSTRIRARMLNAKFAWGTSQRGGGIADFIKDEVELFHGSTQYIAKDKRIGSRHPSSGFQFGDGYSILHDNIQYISMTVRKNAPIDPQTGLHIPTIAVCNSNGISIILENKEVVNLTGSWGTSFFAEFLSDDRLIHQFGNADSQGQIRICDIPTVNTSSPGQIYGGTSLYAAGYDPYLFDHFGGRYMVREAESPRDTVLSGGRRFVRYHEAKNQNKSMVAHITGDTNTGWMPGSVKLATMNETDGVDNTRKNLVLNGTFDTNTANWTGGTGGSISISSGRLVISQVSGSNGRAISDPFYTEANKAYVFSVDGVSSTGGAGFRMEVRGPEIVNNLFTGTGYISFLGTGGTVYVELYCMGGAGTSVTYDNASVVIAEADRSDVNVHLETVGTIRKDPVASGADLNAYSNFSSTNYLKRYYNASLEVGTGDVYFTWWTKTSDALQRVWFDYSNANDWNSPSASNDRLYGIVTSGGQLQFTLGSTTYSSPSSTFGADGLWHHMVMQRRSRTVEFYMDGQLVSSHNNANDNVAADNQILVLGTGIHYPSAPWSGDMTLFRAGNDAISPELIKKIYEDESKFFQNDAKITLDAEGYPSVSGLAHDKYTGLTYVGLNNDNGTSIFRGLNRVGNTGKGRNVTAAISAVNGLVVEE